MAKGQTSYLNLINAVLRRLGKSQIVTADFAGLAADSWGGIIKAELIRGQHALYAENDWSTLMTSGTFSTASRTYDLSTTFSDFGRDVDLVDTDNGIRLEPVNAIDIDSVDPELDNTGTPRAYSIQYPNLLFDRTPSTTNYRIRYIKRFAALSAVTDVLDFPEQCDQVLILWTYWQMMATREDSTDFGGAARSMYLEALARAIAQDKRRMDRVYVMQPIIPPISRRIVPFPPAYDQEYSR